MTQSLRIRVPVPFPATVEGDGGIKVTKNGGAWTIEPDFGSLALIGTPADPTTKQIWVFDPVTGIYNRISLGGTNVGANSITNDKLAPAPSNTLKGNNTGAPTNPTDLTVVQVQTMLGLGGATGVPNAALAQMPAFTLKGNNTNAPAVPADLAAAQANAFLGPAGQAIVDFGAFPGASDTSLVITGQTNIGAGSIILVSICAKDTADHSADEHVADPPRVTAGAIVPGTGFTIFAANNDGVGDVLTYGKWTVNWRWQ